jgi:hypothetical protein
MMMNRLVNDDVKLGDVTIRVTTYRNVESLHRGICAPILSTHCAKNNNEKVMLSANTRNTKSRIDLLWLVLLPLQRTIARYVPNKTNNDNTRSECKYRKKKANKHPTSASTPFPVSPFSVSLAAFVVTGVANHVLRVPQEQHAQIVVERVAHEHTSADDRCDLSVMMNDGRIAIDGMFWKIVD